MAALSSFATALLLGASAYAQTLSGSSATLTVANKVISPDGFSRNSVLVNGVFPAPLISASPSTQFNINVANKLTEYKTMDVVTSVHWHGIFQKSTNYADGTSMITQCPIAPNNSFPYNFGAGGQTGTYWYHSHERAQYCDGLRGPLVIYDPNDPHKSLYDYDNATTVITLADWYHVPSHNQTQPSASQSTLINGLGRPFANPGTSPLAVISVLYGKRYRFRIVSISCDPNYTFSIDGHNMTVIEVDGINTKAYTVDNIQIFAGQRYSVVLTANKAVGNYWIRANPNNPSLSAPYTGGANSAILRYLGAASSNPTTNSTAKLPLVESSIVPYDNAPAPGGASLTASDVYPVVLSFGLAPPNYTVNGVSFRPPNTPVLLQILSGISSAQSLLPKGSVIGLPKNTTIQLSMPAAGIGMDSQGGPHPFHLHGHSFSVIRSAGQTTPNFANPPRRDVVSTGSATDNVTVRFVTDNAGPWFLHCHIDWHLEAGLAVVFAEDVADTKADDPVTTAWSQLCPAWNNLPSYEQ